MGAVRSCWTALRLDLLNAIFPYAPSLPSNIQSLSDLAFREPRETTTFKRFPQLQISASITTIAQVPNRNAETNLSISSSILPINSTMKSGRQEKKNIFTLDCPL